MTNGNAHNDLPAYLFHQGTNFHAHELFGCHFDKADGHAVFRVWAPRARAVSVVGDWNEWLDSAHPMRQISDGGVWEAVIDCAKPLHRYKYAVLEPDGTRKLKADPFAFCAESDGEKASIICDIKGYVWQDGDWMKERAGRTLYDKPVNIYEIHPGSWRRRPDGQPLSYAELAEQIIPYLLEMGYTHLELLPVMEHSSVRSWGYQTTGYFAASSRYGAPQDLMALIDRCHKAGIAVILDWAPAHFPEDANLLEEFGFKADADGQESDRPVRRDWGTRFFDYGRAEVQSFLISSAVFWLETYHADGLRLSEVSEMLYLDFGKRQGEWTPNSDGGNENFEGIDFLQKLNSAISGRFPGAMMIAEESTSWPAVTRLSYEGGLGFQFKWNTGWVRDMLDYVSVDPLYRKMVHDRITHSFNYTFSENYILPIAHDEVVYGKRSLIERMPGEYEWKFAGMRAFLGYMTAHPGKKLHFMGSEIGQFAEWDRDSALEWSLLEHPAHQQIKEYVGDLNRFYLKTPELWENDYSWDGFKWISADDSEQNIVVFMRIDKKNNALVVLQNFAPVIRQDYRFGVPAGGAYKEVFNSDREIYGGWGNENGLLQTEDVHMHGFPYSLRVTVPPLSTVFFRLAE